jgi:hypothetical protein
VDFVTIIGFKETLCEDVISVRAVQDVVQRQAVSWTAERISAFQEGLSCKELVNI